MPEIKKRQTLESAEQVITDDGRHVTRVDADEVIEKLGIDRDEITRGAEKLRARKPEVLEFVYKQEFSSSPTLGKLAGALAKAKLEMSAKIEPDQVNPHYKNKYASLGKILDSITRPLAEQGLIISQDAGATQIHTMLIHESGEWKSTITLLYPRDKGMHGWGGANTYAKRFAISAMVGVATDEDDDGGDGQPTRGGGSRSQGGPPPPTPEAPPSAPIGGDADSLREALANARTSQEINKIAYALNQSVKSGEISPEEANQLSSAINERKAETAR